METRDEKHKEMYLRMYEKGRQTAVMERQEEVHISMTYLNKNLKLLYLFL